MGSVQTRVLTDDRSHPPTFPAGRFGDPGSDRCCATSERCCWVDRRIPPEPRPHDRHGPVDGRICGRVHDHSGARPLPCARRHRRTRNHRDQPGVPCTPSITLVRPFPALSHSTPNQDPLPVFRTASRDSSYAHILLSGSWVRCNESWAACRLVAFSVVTDAPESSIKSTATSRLAIAWWRRDGRAWRCRYHRRALGALVGADHGVSCSARSGRRLSRTSTAAPQTM